MEDLQVQKYVVMQEEKVIGTVFMPPETESWLPAFENVGYRVTSVESRLEDTQAGEAYGLTCDDDNPRPCELGIALGLAQELGREAGIPTHEADALEARGLATEAEVETAVRAIVDRLPSDLQPQGRELLDVAFPQP